MFVNIIRSNYQISELKNKLPLKTTLKKAQVLQQSIDLIKS